uniref:Adaptor protein, phosphotyrosine interacting with PH domain and leucine zipper 2 n=1 Tax=Lepisosteus oculatus TaxID=7918 RepID=W5NEG4_LEPOC
MPAVHKLLLEEALQDSPQMRILLSVGKAVTGLINGNLYFFNTTFTMNRLFKSQNEMSLATQQLSKQLLEYEKQNRCLRIGVEENINFMKPDLNTWWMKGEPYTPIFLNLADSSLIPFVKTFKQCVSEISTLKDIFGIASNEHDVSMAKYSRLPKRKENEKLKADVVAEVAYTRRKQHQASMQYYCALNALQYRKRVAMLEPMLGYMQAQVCFFRKGMDLVSKKMDSFLTSVSNMTQSIQAQLDSESDLMRLSQRDLLSVEDTVYMPDQDSANPPVNRTLIQKAGYLNIRNKTGLVTTAWDRLYFFTQGGNLMCQPRGAVAGGLVLDLDNSSVMAVECEDRRYCFQITSPTGKTSIILQAESKKEYEEWICALNNISRQIYLTDNPEAVAIRLNQTAIQAVTPVTSFEKRHESLQPERVTRSQARGLYSTLGRTIQIDPASPSNVTRYRTSLGQKKKRFQVYCPVLHRRTNPFGETEEDSSSDSHDSLLQQVFAVRFLGSMAVRTGRSREVIYEAMRQVLAARAIHNIFRTSESHLMVTSSSLRLIDPQTQVTRISFQLQDVTQFAAHQENGRLMGFVVEGPGAGEDSEPTLSAFVFESNTEGEKICYTISLGKEITEAKKDPEALAQLMKSVPFTNDGKFLLLDTDPADAERSGARAQLESEA